MPSTNTSTPTKVRSHDNCRPAPNLYGGNFLLTPSLQDYLAPDLTLPEQYFGRQQLDDGLGAERALMYAVLKDGIRSYYKHVGATRRKYKKLWAEAESWLLEDCWDYPFSFRVICDTLGIGADCLRERLVQWKEAELQRRELTGDTASVQVGRSPFPAPIDLDALEASSSSNDECPAYDDESEEDTDTWSGPDTVSLDALAFSDGIERAA